MDTLRDKVPTVSIRKTKAGGWTQRRKNHDPRPTVTLSHRETGGSNVMESREVTGTRKPDWLGHL